MTSIFQKAAVLGVALILLLAGCAGASSSPANSNQNQADSESADEKLPMGTLRFVTDDGEYTGKYVGTQDGYYYFERGEDLSANLRYIDYASAQDIFLSSRPEGNHFAPEDESYISSVAGSGVVFSADDDLYLLRSGAPSYTETYGNDALGAIFVMDLDGSGRKALYTSGAEEVLLPTVAVDDENLYLTNLITQMEDEIPVDHRYLIQINRTTGEKRTLCELTSSAWMIGAIDQYLVFHSIYVDETGSDGIPSMKHEIFVYSFDTQSLAVIKSWPQDQQAVAKVYEGKLVTADMKTMTITVQELTTGKVLKSFSLEGYAPSDGSNFWFDDCRDGKFVFWNWQQETLWGIDLETGEWTAVTLTYQDPDKMEARPMEIYAETEDEFMVCRDKQYMTRKYGTSEGSVGEYEKLCPCFALITKEDYWNSVPNFRDVEWND